MTKLGTVQPKKINKEIFCFNINIVIMTPEYVCVLSFTKMHDCKHIISCTRDNTDGGQSVKQRRKTRLNDGRLVNIVWVNDRRLPLHCWLNDRRLPIQCWLNDRRLVVFTSLFYWVSPLWQAIDIELQVHWNEDSYIKNYDYRYVLNVWMFTRITSVSWVRWVVLGGLGACWTTFVFMCKLKSHCLWCCHCL